jgi:hypothetical protein
LDVFGQLNNPRIDRRKLHPMPEILLLTLCAVICGAESELFGEAKLDILRTFLAFENGDTLRRFFRAIDTQQFQHLFVDWIKAWLNPEVANKVIAIDGKTLRGSHDGAHTAIHLVSVLANILSQIF